MSYGSYTGEFDGSDDLWVRPSGGLVLAPRLTLDTHFAERQREMRLVRMMLDFDDFDRWGVGVDENTALVVQGDVGEVVGENGVYFLDLSSVVFSSDPAADISGLRLTYLTHGDKFHFGSGKFLSRNPFVRQEKFDREYFSMSSGDDIFGGKPNTPAGEFRYTATTLFDSRQSDSSSLSSERNPEFRVDMVKDASSVGYGGYMGDRFLISFVDLLVDVYVNSLE
ncbi:unnamed protein product [Darwinula stevensoni]|uniref:Uncharacterized protein n=1 Tax=Darwinula stevensoni TaxID=69355 RepID=A0A7R8XM38_9CRUS|nr:unnamed protein product [Darwinula stevensoni]CAG0895069.1 unnamed protein product [Darwinula stevensoni]